MKIAVFGRNETVARMRELVPGDKEMLPFIYEKAEETTELLQTVFQCDVYIFTEYLSYLYVKETVERKRLPAVVVESDAYRAIASLYRLQAEENGKHCRVATDVYDEPVADLLHQLKVNDNDIHCYVHSSLEEPNINEVISYYTTLYHDGKIDDALTSSKEITLRLQKESIPARTIALPDRYLENALKEAVTLVELSDSENNLLVTGTLSLRGINKDTDLTEEQLKAIDDIHNILNKFTEDTDASFVEIGDRQFVIHGSDKLLRHLREHYRVFPLLKKLKEAIPLTLYLGFGLGLNAKEAQANSKLALDKCTKSDQSICYIVNERQEVIGPIGVKKEFDTSSLYQALIHDAKLNNELSYHFIDFINERNNEPFSTNDVATFYQVTKRSAERTVSKLLSGDVIKIAGEERPYRKGRPRKLFTLNQ